MSPVGGHKQYPAPIEHDVATVESTISGRSWELPAMWNRMFEQRVIWDYDTAGFEKIDESAIAKWPTVMRTAP